MGKVTINSHIGDGQYNVTIDLGEQVRDDRIAAIDEKIVVIDDELIEKEDSAATAKAALDNAETELNIAIDALISAPKDDNGAERAAATTATSTALNASADYAIANIGVSDLEHRKSSLEQEKITLQGLELLVDQTAWCCDLTTTASGESASIEIPGENNYLLIAPSAVPHVADDGYLLMRDIQDGNQCYYNAAILPGWQKFSPTYRLGVLTAFGEGETCSVTLDVAKSSADQLLINQSLLLENVTIEYMSCGSFAFDINDRVVVKFEDQDWSKPKVIGFEDYPKSCTAYLLFPTSNADEPSLNGSIVSPGGAGGAPKIQDGANAPALGYDFKFMHDSMSYVVSSGKHYIFSKGNGIRHVVDTEIAALFVVDSGRVVVVDNTGVISASGLGGGSTTPYDIDTNPNGYLDIGTMPRYDKIFVRPDGGKIYGFDSTGYCSVTINADGFSVINDASVAHDVNATITNNTTATGVSPKDSGFPASGDQSQSQNYSESYSAVVGVIWTGSAGSWSEQLVTMSHSVSLIRSTDRSWSRATAGIDTPVDFSESFSKTYSETLTLSAGGFYNKVITDINWTYSGSGSRDAAPSWLDAAWTAAWDRSESGSGTRKNLYPSLLGSSDYIEERDNTDITEIVSLSGSGAYTYDSTVTGTAGGNKAIDGGSAVDTGPVYDLPSRTDTSVPSSMGYGYTMSMDYSGAPDPYTFEDVGDILTGYVTVISSMSDQRFAETAETFMVATFYRSKEYHIAGPDVGDDGQRGPYLSTFGYIESLLGISSTPTDLPTGIPITMF